MDVGSMSRTLANGWPRLPRLVLACGLAVSSGCGSRPAAGGTDTGTISIVIGAEPTLPLPTLSSAKANTDVASLLFLPLARPGPDLATTDESSFVPVSRARASPRPASSASSAGGSARFPSRGASSRIGARRLAAAWPR
jgi:hypothetical protein